MPLNSRPGSRDRVWRMPAEPDHGHSPTTQSRICGSGQPLGSAPEVSRPTAPTAPTLYYLIHTTVCVIA